MSELSSRLFGGLLGFGELGDLLLGDGNGLLGGGVAGLLGLSLGGV